MKMCLFGLPLLLGICWILLVGAGETRCPVGCQCEPSLSAVRVKCSGQLWSQLRPENTAIFSSMSALHQIDFSSNTIATLETSFLNVPALKKLNLSDNKIARIAVGAFTNLTGLTTLDLSGNKLQNLSRTVLSPLKALERLKIRSNLFTTLPSDVFIDLTRLKTLDASENKWNCDCSLAWISDWIKSANIKLMPAAKCAQPESLVNFSLKRLDVQCVRVGIELTPEQDQVVFAGDSLALRCRALGVVDRVQWMWRDITVEQQFTEVTVEEHTLPEHGLAESLVRIERLEPQHSGDWVCRQMTSDNLTSIPPRTVSVLVLSDSTRYCPPSVTTDNKGSYFWPRTVVSHTIELPCAGSDSVQASYNCNLQGEWEHMNTSQCPFTSETTRILQGFASDNLTGERDAVVEKAKHLLNLTRATEKLTDPIDVILVSRTVEMYTQYLLSNRDLPGLLIDVIAGLQRCDSGLLLAAEVDGLACSRLRRSLERLGLETPTLQYHGPLLAMEEFSVAPNSFTGMTCFWRRSGLFDCSTNGRGLLEGLGRNGKAAVSLPVSLFDGVEPSSISHPMLITMFDGGHLFPDDHLPSNQLSPVIGVNIGGFDVYSNLTEPVSVTVEVSLNLREIGHLVPLWWDPHLRGGSGGWSTEGCEMPPSSPLDRHFTTFLCYRVGYYAVSLGPINHAIWESSVLGQALLYSGSCVLLVCLLLSFVTYVICHRAVQMSRRAKHAVANTWLSIILLCFLFSFGVLATDDVKICEGIGLSLHYFSLSTLLWMAVAGNHLYKRVSRGVIERAADDLPPAPGVPLHKPILGLYLVGWGVSLIVCGISGAVHLRDYAQPAFCFLGAGPALSAVYVPTAILVTILCVLTCLTFCAIRNDVNGQLSEGTQGTENVDLELLEDGACQDRMRGPSAPSELTQLTDSEEMEDPEHAPIIQLKAHVIVLLLFLLLWSCAALATMARAHPFIPDQQLIATAFYCLTAFCLGAFILYFYCVARSDVRARWGVICRLQWLRCRNRSVSDARASLPLHTVPSSAPRPGRASSVASSSSTQQRSKAVMDLNNCESPDHALSKPSNSVNLVAMHRQIYRSNNSMPTYQEIASQNCADVFYNPRQSIVAKKFFKKQRRNRRNELGMRRRGDGGGTSEGEASQAARARRTCAMWRPSAESAVFLSSDMENSAAAATPNLFKINNTNIHVPTSSNLKKKETNSPKNPNVLSEDDEDKGNEKLLLSRLVIGAEEGVEVTPLAPECRSVELQCSLGDSSDSFCHKIDNLRLPSDEHSELLELPEPPHYVTVLDPKYGVVKVTLSDYQQQSHRLCHQHDRRSLPSSPEARHLHLMEGNGRELQSSSRLSVSCDDSPRLTGKDPPPGSSSPSSDGENKKETTV